MPVSKTNVRPDSAWCIYLLECGDGTLYCGVTTDPARRLAEHNGELPGGARYTAARRPVRLAAAAAMADRAAACRAEAWVKRLPKAKKLAAVIALADKKDERER